MSSRPSSASPAPKRIIPLRVQMADEGETVDDMDPLLELFGPEDQEEAPSRGPTWLEALGQLTCGALVLGAIVAFIAAATFLRRVWRR